MNISELFKAANDTVTSDTLIPITKLKDEEYKKMLEKKWNAKLPNYEFFKKGMDYLGLDDKYFYATGNFVRPYYYKNGWVLVDINTFDIEYLKMFDVKERIELNEKGFKEAIKTNDFQRLFYLDINEAIRFPAFQGLFDIIPDEKKYEIFIDIYTTSEYGFKELDKDFVRKVFTYRPQKVQNQVAMELMSETDENGFVKIYRGVGTISTPPTEAFSWTTSFYTALFFAGKHDVVGDIYEAKVHINHIVDFLEGRGEAEVLVDPNNIVEMHNLNMERLEDIIEEMTNNGYLEIYHDAAEKIKPELFWHAKGLHGVLHCKRVLMLTTMLSMMEGLNDDDRKILIKAAQYHDIGRVHDERDDEHGRLSIQKMKKLKLFRNNKTQKDEILKFIIENHCLNDNIAFENVNDYKITDKEHATYLLSVFKDADGLDRVRLSDLDIKYIRNENAKKLGVIAFLLRNHLK